MAASHSVVLYEPTETSPEVTTAAGFLAGYSGRTREAYTLDLRQFIGWCGEHRLGMFEITRTHIEPYARQLEEEGTAPAIIGRRLSTLAELTRTQGTTRNRDQPLPLENVYTCGWRDYATVTSAAGRAVQLRHFSFAIERA